MPLGSRDVLFILRARDQASRTLLTLGAAFTTLDKKAQRAAVRQVQVGGAMVAVGAGIAAVGVAGLAVTKNWSDAASAYSASAALTLTQVDQAGVSLNTIKDIARDVAKEIPAPFEQMQKALYDIFSSMDVNTQEAKVLLEGFSKAAVAGQVDISKASRATIGILNAYQMPASKVNRINDIMFELVRKGIGTYSEFSSTIGRSVPSAIRAGQSVESLAGMLAFLTRNNLSAAMASTSSARALDAIAHPSTVAKMKNLGEIVDNALGAKRQKELGLTAKSFKDMGIDVRDSAGNFRPINEIMTEMGTKLKGLTKPEMANVFQNLFKGSGGTIQARRFFDIAVRNFGELNQRTKEMRNSKGAMKDAYDIMFKEPQTQAQLLKNNIAVLRTQMGDAFLPTLNKLMKIGIKVVQWFQDLSPGTKRAIGLFIAFGSIIAIVVGVLTVIAGVFLILHGALALIGVGFGVAIATIGLFIAAVVAIAVIVVLIVKYHDEIWQFIQMIWDVILRFFNRVWQAIYETIKRWIGMAVDHIARAWNAVYAAAVTAWDSIASFFNTVWDAIYQAVVTALNAVWNFIVQVFNEIKATFVNIWQNEILQFFRDILGIIYQTARIWLLTLWNIVKLRLTLIWQTIVSIWNSIKNVFIVVFNFLKPYFKEAWNTIKQTVINVWNNIKLYISTAVNAIKTMVVNAWNNIKQVTSAIWNAIKSVITDRINTTKSTISSTINGIKSVLSTAWNTIKSTTSTSWEFIKRYIVNPIKDAYNGIVHWIGNIVGALDRLWERAKETASKIRDALSKVNPANWFSLPLTIQTAIGMSDLEKNVLKPLARMERDTNKLGNRIRSNMDLTGRYSGERATARPAITRPVVTSNAGGPTSIDQKITINTQEIDPRRHAAELGWMLASRS